MKKFTTLFLFFGFIMLHMKVTGSPVAFNTDHIASITDSKTATGVLVRTVGNEEPFLVRESFEEILQMIQ